MSALAHRLLSVASAFNPLLAIPWEAACWADDPSWSHPADGGAVSSWRNGGSRAGAGDLVQSTGANQPTYRASVAALANRPAVEFDGTNDNMATANFSSSYSGAVSLVAIVKRNGAGSGSDQRIIDVSGSTTYTTIIGRSSANKWSIYNSGWVDGPTWDTSPHLIWTYQTSGTNATKITVDGSTTAGTAGAAKADYFRVGGWPASNFFGGTFAFAGLYAGDVSAHEQWPAFRAWARAYYGLP